MRLSLVSTAVCGTVAVSALTLPQFPRRGLDGIVDTLVGDLVDLVPFLADSFTTISPEDAAASAAASKFAGPDDSSSMDAADNKSEANSTLLAGTCKSPRVRYEWRDMTDAHKLEFVTSVKCLMNKPSGGSQFTGSKNRFEDLASVHQQMTPKIHMVAQFLPWHRYFLNIYETMLRNECGYTGPMPWWDESKDAGRFSQAPMFTDTYFGRAPLKTADGKGTCITSGVSIPAKISSPNRTSLTFFSSSLHYRPSRTPPCMSDLAVATPTTVSPAPLMRI
jgi:tyrosinase